MASKRVKNLFDIWQEDGYMTDKHSTHHYFTIYDPLFSPFKHRPIGLFEVGTNTGGSTILWDKYFDHPGARIRSIDIIDVPESHKEYTKRVRLDIIDINELTISYFEYFPVDIAIDDGSHILSEQVAFVKLLYPILRTGGLLIIEDVNDIEKTTEAMKELNYPFYIVNFNPIDNWYDSVLFIFTK